MKIKIEYDIDTTSRYDYEPIFRIVKKYELWPIN